MAETPWGEMMRVAMGWGVEPRVFWSLSLREWRMLTQAVPGSVPLGRGEFEQLMAAWPDGE